MLSFLVYLLVLCIVFGLLYYIVTLLPLPVPFKNVAMILLLLILVVLLLAALFGSLPLPKWSC